MPRGQSSFWDWKLSKYIIGGLGALTVIGLIMLTCMVVVSKGLLLFYLFVHFFKQVLCMIFSIDRLDTLHVLGCDQQHVCS